MTSAVNAVRFGTLQETGLSSLSAQSVRKVGRAPVSEAAEEGSPFESGQSCLAPGWLDYSTMPSVADRVHRVIGDVDFPWNGKPRAQQKDLAGTCETTAQQSVRWLRRGW